MAIIAAFKTDIPYASLFQQGAFMQKTCPLPFSQCVLAITRSSWRHTVRLCMAAPLLLPLLAAATPTAEEEGFYWQLQQDFTRDDNLFRLPDDQSPATSGFGTERSDTISTTAATLGFQHRYSLQKLHADITVAHKAYQNYDYLDHTATNLHGYWDWAIGRFFTGRILATQDEALRGFGDYAYASKSMNTFRRASADGNYWFHPDWSVGLGLSRVTSTYSDAPSAVSEYEERAAEAAINFRTGAGNLIALVTRHTDGEYPGRINNGSAPTEYRQNDLQLRGGWTFSGASQLSGYIGYTDRGYRNFSNRDFDGLTGRLSYKWSPTGKLKVSANLRRELGAQEDLTDNYVVTSAANIGADWSLSGLFTLGSLYEYRRRNFGGDPGLGVSPTVGKNDRTRFLLLALDYLPLTWLTVRLHVQFEEREGEQSTSDYSDTLTGLTATARF